MRKLEGNYFNAIENNETALVNFLTTIKKLAGDNS